MGYLGSNNVHPQQFTDNFIKNFSVKVKKTTFFIFLLKTCVSYPNFWNFKKIIYRGYFGAKMEKLVLSPP